MARIPWAIIGLIFSFSKEFRLGPKASIIISLISCSSFAVFRFVASLVGGMKRNNFVSVRCSELYFSEISSNRLL